MPESENSARTLAEGLTLASGQTLISISAQNGDVVTIDRNFTGEISIPASITALTQKAMGHWRMPTSPAKRRCR